MSPVADKKNNAGMGLGHQGGDLNVSPAADKKNNAGMGVGAPGWRSQRVTSCRQEGQCRHGGGAQGGDLNVSSPVADKKDNVGGGGGSGANMVDNAGTGERHQGGDINAFSCV